MESAISAPVLPQEMTTGDSPAFTASSALSMLVPWALRSTREGLSSMATTPGACRTSVRPASAVPCAIERSSSAAVAVQDVAQARVLLERHVHAAHDVGDPAVAAHGVDRDDDVAGGGRRWLAAGSVRGVAELIPDLASRRQGSGRFVVEVDLFGPRHDLAAVVVAAGAADVVRAAQLAAVRALVGIAGDQRVMRPAHAALGARDLAFRNSHVSASISAGPLPGTPIRRPAR